MSLSTITIKIFFLSSLLISLRCKSVNRGSCIRTNISICGDCLVNMPVGLINILIKLIDMPVKLIGILIKLTDILIEVI